MNTPDILLIDPPRKERIRKKRRPNKAGCIPDLGLISIASVLEKDGYNIKYLDAKALGLDIIECCKEVVKLSPKYIGITSMTPNISMAAALAEAIKTELDIPIILGGVHVSATPELTLEKYSAFDVAVIGEGEITAKELLNAMDNDSPLKEIDGIAYREENKIIITKPRKMITNLDLLPFPAWHLLPELKKYYQPPFGDTRKLPSNHIMTSRGCYGKCIFCDKSVSGDQIRMFSVDYVMEMINILIHQYGIRNLHFHDDIFFSIKKNAHAICDKLIEKKWNLTWSCLGRVNNIDSSLAEKMKRAGCWQIGFGIESGSQEILDFIKKGVKLEEIKKAVSLTKKAGIEVSGYLMMGHPKETKASINKTIDLLIELDVDNFEIGYFVPFPGSQFHSIAEQYGRFNDNWDTMETVRPDSFIPYGLTRKELIHYTRVAYLRFCLRPKYIFSWIKKLKNSFYVMRFIRAIIFFFKRLFMSYESR